MALKKTNTGQRRLQDAKGLYITPYKNGILGEETYDIHDIVGDTISITQDDAERTEIPWEFGDDNLDENVKAGKRTFTCQCIDYQNDILAKLFGCEPSSDGKVIIFPKEYKDLYVMIRVQFEKVDLVLPYVKMDAKTTIENLRTDIARGELTGTVLSHEVGLGDAPDSNKNTKPGSGQTKYVPTEKKDTPMLFVDESKAVYVKKADDEWITDFR